MSRVLALAAVLLALPASAALDVDETLFTERSLGLTLHVPEGWTASTQTGYPGLLLLLQAPAPATRSRIVVTGGEVQGKTLAQLVNESLPGLRAVGLAVLRSQRTTLQGRTVWEVTARVEKRDTEVRQLYLLEGRRAISLTLAGPAAEVARLQGDLQQVLAGLRIQ